jgi:hypothetical protein
MIYDYDYDLGVYAIFIDIEQTENKLEEDEEE